MRRLGLALIAATLMAGPAKPEARLLDWADLHGWASDDHAEALVAFNETCGDLTEGDWPAICAYARDEGDPRTFFETFFRPVLLTDDEEPLFTGYYEPELPARAAAQTGSACPSIVGQMTRPLAFPG